MKHILAPILLLVLLFPSLALGEEVRFDELVKFNGLYYKKFTDVPFTGKTTGKLQETYKDGILDGPWIRYHDNGRLMSKGHYKNGKLYGPWVVYHENGQLMEKGDRKNFIPVGPYVYYHDNGQIESKGEYKEGRKEGPWVSYHRDGTIDEEYTGIYKNGEKVE